jgi:hypothetical protein
MTDKNLLYIECMLFTLVFAVPRYCSGEIKTVVIRRSHQDMSLVLDNIVKQGVIVGCMPHMVGSS